MIKKQSSFKRFSFITICQFSMFLYTNEEGANLKAASRHQKAIKQAETLQRINSYHEALSKAITDNHDGLYSDDHTISKWLYHYDAALGEYFSYNPKAFAQLYNCGKNHLDPEDALLIKQRRSIAEKLAKLSNSDETIRNAFNEARSASSDSKFAGYIHRSERLRALRDKEIEEALSC